MAWTGGARVSHGLGEFLHDSGSRCDIDHNHHFGLLVPPAYHTHGIQLPNRVHSCCSTSHSYPGKLPTPPLLPSLTIHLIHFMDWGSFFPLFPGIHPEIPTFDTVKLQGCEFVSIPSQTVAFQQANLQVSSCSRSEDSVLDWGSFFFLLGTPSLKIDLFTASDPSHLSKITLATILGVAPHMVSNLGLEQWTKMSPPNQFSADHSCQSSSHAAASTHLHTHTKVYCILDFHPDLKTPPQT